MDKAAADHGAKAITTDLIASDATIPGVPDSAQLVQAAFTGKKGDAPRIAPAGQGAMAVYQAVDIQPAHMRRRSQSGRATFWTTTAPKPCRSCCNLACRSSPISPGR